MSHLRADYGYTSQRRGAVGKIGGTMVLQEITAFYGRRHILPVECGHFMYATILNHYKSGRYFRLLVGRAGTGSVRRSIRHIRKHASKGNDVYIVSLDDDPVHPYDYECIMDLLSPEAHSDIARQQRDFMLSLERLDIPACTDEATAEDIVDYF